MAPKLPKFFDFSTLDSKSRIFLLFFVVIALGFLIYVGTRFFGGGTKATGASSVANAPSELQSVPGSQLSQEYYRALMQANTQAAQQAKITGGSAVPTLVNVPGQQSDCTVLCPGDEAVNVADDINNLVRAGKLSQDD